jgi:uncharacterized protein YaaN involved in tellurite resistance
VPKKVKKIEKSYDELKAEMEALEKEMALAKQVKRKASLKLVKQLCKEFGFTHSMLKDSLKEGRKKISK